MKQPEAPCLSCGDRHLGCHSECDKYSDFVKKRREYMGHIKKQKTDENILQAIEINRFKR